MPRNRFLTEPANGLTRCRICQEVKPAHKHGVWDHVLFRWDRNKGVDRPLVVVYGLAWVFAASVGAAIIRDIIARWSAS